ncbi:unannotated protein [freshwater metagenome]|uniref:Unannotated protein n=1 Tax=freshwater metagenome TaxID=449393 RepID=A0A6J6J1B4_9ZZZZ|nr:hypothetical protein [Actinomycetota bacterium]
METLSKGIAMAAAAAVIGFGGFTATTASAATNDEIATYLTDAVAIQLGLTSTDSLHQLIVDAMANNLIDPALTGAAGASVDGLSTLTPEELATLLDANLTTQLATIEQTLIDLGVYPNPNTPVDPPVVGDDADSYVDDDAAYEDEDESLDMEDDSDVDVDVDVDDDAPGRSNTAPNGIDVGHTSHGNGLGLGHLNHGDED